MGKQMTQSEQQAFQRGAEAMREAAAKQNEDRAWYIRDTNKLGRPAAIQEAGFAAGQLEFVAKSIRSLPIPEPTD
jgi:hypothetical protein